MRSGTRRTRKTKTENSPNWLFSVFVFYQIITVKQLPEPGADSTLTEPPCSSAISFTSGSPRPLPEFSLREASACQKRCHILSCSSGSNAYAVVAHGEFHPAVCAPKRKPYVAAPRCRSGMRSAKRFCTKACKQLRIVARAYSVRDIRVQAYAAPVLGHIVLAYLAHKLRHVALGKG